FPQFIYKETDIQLQIAECLLGLNEFKKAENHAQQQLDKLRLEGPTKGPKNGPGSQAVMQLKFKIIYARSLMGQWNFPEAEKEFHKALYMCAVDDGKMKNGQMRREIELLKGKINEGLDEAIKKQGRQPDNNEMEMVAEEVEMEGG
ncbi:hypothetical protein Vafri_6087, partial [Volvox africanus]